MQIVIRDTGADDIEAIQRIYAFYVLNSVATFEEEPPTADEMHSRWANISAQGLPYLVAEVDGVVAGYTYVSPFRPRPAYRHTIEDSICIANGLTGRGIGRELLAELLRRCGCGPWRQMVAVIARSGNHASVRLHERFGFRHVGTLSAVGFKLGDWADTVLMQRGLGAGGRTPPGILPPCRPLAETSSGQPH